MKPGLAQLCMALAAIALAAPAQEEWGVREYEARGSKHRVDDRKASFAVYMVNGSGAGKSSRIHPTLRELIADQPVPPQPTVSVLSLGLESLDFDRRLYLALDRLAGRWSTAPTNRRPTALGALEHILRRLEPSPPYGLDRLGISTASPAGIGPPPTFPPAFDASADLRRRVLALTTHPDRAALAEDLVAAIRNRTSFSEPDDESSWLDWRLWTLEPLLRTDLAPETLRFRRERDYEQHCEEVFAALVVERIEPRTQRLATSFIGSTIHPPRGPALIAEPQFTVFRRSADAYGRLRRSLEAAVGRDALQSEFMVGFDGAKNSSLFDALSEIERRWRQAAALACHVFGADPTLAGDGIGVDEATKLAQECRDRLQRGYSDEELDRDRRILHELGWDEHLRQYRCWIQAGLTVRYVCLHYVDQPEETVTPQDGKPHGRPWAFEVRGSVAVISPVWIECSVDRVPTPAEIEAFCDGCETLDEIRRWLPVPGERGQPVRARPRMPELKADQDPVTKPPQALWLTRHQEPDGRFSSDEFVAHCDPALGERCDGKGSGGLDISITGLLIFALANLGYDSNTPGPYRDCIRTAGLFLTDQQDSQGRFGSTSSPHFAHQHACATLAMQQLFSSTRQKTWRNCLTSASKALDRDPEIWPWTSGAEPTAEGVAAAAWLEVAFDPYSSFEEIPAPKGAQDALRSWIDGLAKRAYARKAWTAVDVRAVAASLMANPINRGEGTSKDLREFEMAANWLAERRAQIFDEADLETIVLASLAVYPAHAWDDWYREVGPFFQRRFASAWDPLESTCRHASLSIL